MSHTYVCVDCDQEFQRDSRLDLTRFEPRCKKCHAAFRRASKRATWSKNAETYRENQRIKRRTYGIAELADRVRKQIPYGSDNKLTKADMAHAADLSSRQFTDGLRHERLSIPKDSIVSTNEGIWFTRDRDEIAAYVYGQSQIINGLTESVYRSALMPGKNNGVLDPADIAEFEASTLIFRRNIERLLASARTS